MRGILTYFIFFLCGGHLFVKRIWPPSRLRLGQSGGRVPPARTAPQEKPLPILFPASRLMRPKCPLRRCRSHHKNCSLSLPMLGRLKAAALLCWRRGAHPRRKLGRIEAASFQRCFRLCFTGVRACAGQEGDGGEKTQEPTLGRMVLTLVRSPEPLSKRFWPRPGGRNINEMEMINSNLPS